MTAAPTIGAPTSALNKNPDTQRPALVRCVDVHKSYHLQGQDVVALRGIDLTITEPGFFAIMGASGSGKSTLLHLLAALDKPERGEVHINGKPVHQMSERDLTIFRRTEIGIVFQQFNLIPTLTGIENVELPGLLAGKSEADLRPRARELLEALGLEARGHHRPDALSGGEQQRVAIARALLFGPKLLLADEPTGNLDSVSSARLWELLARLAKERDMTVLMVTHEPSAAANCEKIYVLKDGKMFGELKTEGLDASGVAARYQQLVRTA